MLCLPLPRWLNLQFTKQASSLGKVFKESPSAFRLSFACSNSAHTPGQAVIKPFPAPPGAPANVLTEGLGCGQCSQGAPPQCPLLSHLLPELFCWSRCCPLVLLPELLQKFSIALGLGNHLSGTLESAASKASSDGHVLFILKGTARVGQGFLLATLNFCAEN